ncbi:enoyl-CoA hydratase [Acidocella aquatica]|uniref:Enoyl-CoA hydratase n=1 Tax=Acidocella aquatica TaxID=1922313 RepID=A0ABQ6A716_9PROT|nr:enoyl-CoA hydratase/isomerase family protein [Acidocella aquatica]GLR67448.1 enoyl-CoA hydratase [Acidocella aquatica]
MEDCQLKPWMLRQDWREDRRPWLLVDLHSWPADEPLGPLPPVPVLAVGPADHRQAARADILVEDTIPLATLTAGIAQTPRAAATVAQLLRATENLPPERALPLESFAMAMLQSGAEHAAWLARQPRTIPLAPGTLHLRRVGATLHMLMDRPASYNAIDRAMRDALYEAFSLPLLDTDIAHVTFRARGRCFSMGADLAEFGTTLDPVEAHAIRARTLPTHPMAQRAEIFDIHVHGACVGSGLEMAAFAGRLTAAPNAWFQLPETGMGILPGFGGCVSVPRRIGRQRAAALMLSGRRIGAATALQWGLIDAIVDEPAADDGGTNMLGG